jgi:hypothetical protein
MSFYDDASWLLIPSGIKEDVVYAQKPTSGLGDLNFTRASDATYTDSTGVVRRSPYNLLQQSEMFSNAIWTKTGSTIGIDATVAPNGTMTADKLVEDTSTGEHNVRQDYSTTVTGSFFASIYAKASGRSFLQFVSSAAFVSSRVNFDLTNGTVTAQGVGVTGTIESAGNGWWRCIVSATSSGSGTVRTQWNLITSGTAARVESYTGNGTSGVFIWGAQLVEGTSALDYFPTTNRQDVPRIDFRNADGTLSSCGRLLLEPQRTNSIRNSTMVGAVAGTPGTLPTNWSASAAGLTQTIVGTGVENGVPYIDFRFNGTAISTGVSVRFETTTGIAASNTQVWTATSWLRFIAQPTPPLSTTISMAERTAAGGLVVVGSSSSLSVTSSLNRFSFTRTLSGGATVGAIQPEVSFNLTNGAAYDFTFRIAAPQMELGAYATTWVPTTTAAVTRIADAASKTGVSSLIGQTQGTLFLELIANRTGINQNVELGDGTTNNRITLRLTLGNTFQFIIVQAGAVVYNQSSVTTFAQSQRIKIAAAYKSGDVTQLYVNGASVASATAGTITGNFSAIYSSSNGGTLDPIFSPIAQAALFPTRLTNAQLAEITTL